MESISRRKFIQLSSAAGSFFVIGYLPTLSGREKLVAKAVSDHSEISLNQFISISSDNNIVLFNHRPEMGQGTYQSIPMILAEELEVEIDKVNIKPSIADVKLYGSQMVVGSRSIQTEFEKLRKMGAAAREMLRQAAATKWNIEISQCKATKGTVVNSSGASFTYGQLVQDAARLTPPENPPLKSRSEFSIIGKATNRRDIPSKTNGEAKFGIDITVPDMLYASIERSPLFLGKVKSFNGDEVLKMPGVRHVLKTSREVYEQQREGVAVLADSYWQALQARKALKIEWDTQGLEAVSGETILKDYYEAAKTSGDDLFTKGDVSAAFAGAANVIQFAYETPYQAHVCMEPMNALVHVTSTEATFWGSTQNPNGIRTFLAKTYQLPENQVHINYTFMGGGFGRRSMTDVVEEAADLSKKSGAPVKVIWTRDEDLTQGPFRACSLNVCRAVMDSGKVTALEHKVVAQEIQNQTGEDMKAGRQIVGGINTDYNILNLSVKGVLRKLHIPISYWRSVYHSTNVFAHESFIDELAHMAGKDPLKFRLDMLANTRFQRLLEAVADKTNWNSPRRNGTGKGVAVAERSGAHFAQVIEVEQRGKQIVPVKVTTVIDVGICINPDTVKAQTEGSVVMGLGAAYVGLTVNKGAVVEQNFDTYPPLKIDQCPEIQTFIVDSDTPPDGAGEAGLPTVAPALANAIFNLTGKRIRKLPMDLKKII
ncbi:MAG TPA: molybdopterin cofactor-binding domain-containing protein [Cyclobacteriaceae bacterium]|nr:molybdopterin cofactor-binding domain-containing protein [Cyclobacteriaceae bacterium]